jgi:hypothetical protein
MKTGSQVRNQRFPLPRLIEEIASRTVLTVSVRNLHSQWHMRMGGKTGIGL